jgi:PST family polysaccharide transporter
VLARLLTPADFGLVAMVTVVWLLLLNFGNIGFNTVIVRQKNLKRSEVSSLFWINLCMSCGIALAFALSAFLLAKFYDDERVTMIGVVLAFAIILMSLSTEHLGLMRRGMMFGRIGVNDVAASAISVGASIGLAITGVGYWALVVKQVVFFASSAVGAWLLCAWRPGAPFFGGGVGAMVKYAVYTYGNYCVTYVSRNLDKVLVGKFLGVQALGFYDRAYQFSGMFANQLTVPLTSVVVSTLSRFADEPERFSKYLQYILSMVAFIGMGLSAVLVVTGEDLIVILLGAQWMSAGEIFCGFAAGLGVFFVYTTNGWIHLSLGRADRWFRWSLFGLAGSTVACLLGLKFGPMGVAIANSLYFAVFVLPALVYAGKPLKLNISFFVEAIWKYLVSAILAVMLCWFATDSLYLTVDLFRELDAPVRICALGLLCAGLYVLFVVAAYRSTEPISQLLRLSREMRSKRK